ncbi:related to reticuline oxidase precursor; berberine bridge enzyme [Cephalotrichum gorgonifer]|uniref:Related to reticuline oxidase berberine bridge enzyme n=1 Tax=Cephalotrichum gorgonifer TaxID=2041049 RepID=A0AAE8SV61_9PEZI|nr:related to reticuline oxidase precursor; berberine bridge enzyme [Cephalotrichum gorgonifer]
MHSPKLTSNGGLAPLLLPLLRLLPLAAASTLESCLESYSVPFNEQNTTAWDNDAAPFNTRLPYVPAAIAVPLTTAHIEDAIRCAVEFGVKVNPKSGGHSYASLGLGVLDTRVYVADEFSILASSVGIGGHVLHGGFGMSSFTHGLALDAITALTVTLANSTTVRATASDHPDLFWALRGAGSSMGVVSEFEFATFEPPEELTHFEVQLGWNDTESVVEGWLELQKWGEEEMPREMNMRFGVDGRGVRLDGLYHGGLEDAEEVVLPLVERLGGGLFTGNVTYDWLGQLKGYAAGEPINSTRPYRAHEKFYAKSLTTRALPRAAIESFTDYFFNNASTFLSDIGGGDFPGRVWWLLIDIQGGANSRISEIPAESSAYAHRDKLLLFQFYDRVFFGDYPEDEAEGYALLDGFVESVTSKLDEDDWGMYVNYADPRTEGVAEEVYYRQNVGRLREVKAAVDPTDVFYNPLGIKPAEVSKDDS